MSQFNKVYRNKIDGFSVVYQFHQGCGLSSAFRKNCETYSINNIHIFAYPLHSHPPI